MQSHQREFLDLALQLGALRFGEFTVKSGRISPYFFNTGLFDSGAALAKLGRFYARTIVASEIDFDVLYGPAYKGIPLAAVTAAALYDQHGLDVPYAFNRKEVKDHGEGGRIVGHALSGGILIIDDVITAGTAIRESMEIIAAEGATAVGVVIALDREERGQGARSAIQEIEASYRLPVAPIVRLADLVDFIAQRSDIATGYLDKIEAYRREYGV